LYIDIYNGITGLKAGPTTSSRSLLVYSAGRLYPVRGVASYRPPAARGVDS
jgi:hypothetical protein